MESARRSQQSILHPWNAPARVYVDRLRVLHTAHRKILLLGRTGRYSGMVQEAKARTHVHHAWQKRVVLKQ